MLPSNHPIAVALIGAMAGIVVAIIPFILLRPHNGSRTLAGVVKDESSHTIKDARVSLETKGSVREDYSDSDGRFGFVIEHAELGKLTVQRNGYQEVVRNLQFPEDHNIEQIHLQPVTADSTAHSSEVEQSAPSPFDGHWKLHQIDEPPEYEAAAWMTIKVNGTNLAVVGDGEPWSGKGSFKGYEGYYDWTFDDGRTGRTNIQLGKDGLLYGEVKEKVKDSEGSGINWHYWGIRVERRVEGRDAYQQQFRP